MFKYPIRYVFDVLMLMCFLVIPACALWPTQPKPQPPCVDMSGATLQWQGTTEIQRLPPVTNLPGLY